MLIAVGSVCGQSSSLTISPPNPKANQPITFSGNYDKLSIYRDTAPLSSGTCDAVFDSGLTPIATLTAVNPTLTAGLPAGTYDAVANYAAFSANGASLWSTCTMFTVSSA
jgi:hypothetical protein